MIPHLSFLGEVLNVEMCVMGVPSNWIDERGLGMVELEVVCMGWREGCSRLLGGKMARACRRTFFIILDLVWNFFCCNPIM